MADDAAFSGPKGKGPPKWLMIGGAVAGVLGLAVLVMRNTSGGSSNSTTSAGTSINAALGSLQEEQMNLLGTVQAGALQNSANFQATSGQIADSTSQILQSITDSNTSLQSQITGAVNTINANTNSNNQGLMAALTNWVNTIQGNEANILSQVQAVNQNVTTVGSTAASNWSTSQQQMADMLTQIQNAAATVNQTENTANSIATFTNNIGNFLGWEYYQIPNRYTPYLPSGPGGSLNVAA